MLVHDTQVCSSVMSRYLTFVLPHVYLGLCINNRHDRVHPPARSTLEQKPAGAAQLPPEPLGNSNFKCFYWLGACLMNAHHMIHGLI
jgi:hypothetical protein